MCNELRIKVYERHPLQRFPCGLCGKVIDKRLASAALIDDATNTEYAKDIRDACLDAGRDGAAKRMLDYAERLKAHAQCIEQGAERVRRIAAENWAESRQVKEMADRADREWVSAMGGDPMREIGAVSARLCPFEKHQGQGELKCLTN